MLEKIALTGWAWRTPLGNDASAITRLLAGESAAQINPHFDASSYGCPLAAAILTPPKTSKHQRYLRRMGLFALEIAQQLAFDYALQGSERLGLFFGYGGLRAHWQDLMPAFAGQTPDAAQCWQRGLNLLHPFWMLQHLSNNAHAIAAQELGAAGDGATYSGANAGAQALLGACRALQLGSVDQALVVAYDSLLEPENLVEYVHAGSVNPHPLHALQAPYSSSACGFVPGEAACAVLLERASATKRTPLSYLEARASADGQPQLPQMASLAQLAHQLWQPGDVFDGAGIAQNAYDAAELAMLANLIQQPSGAQAASLTCLASSFGQTGAAHSVLQAIALSLCLQRQQLPGMVGIGAAANSSALHPLIHTASSQARAALALSASAPGLAAAIRVEI